ncbi:MAG: 3-phosphoshikimate 1-carboxyvinyltransferase [Thermoproteota archaeon]|jgi:3-phosphoshikimate 1-carboxyvinyltransferase
MKVVLFPSTIRGKIKAPQSKSIGIRLIFTSLFNDLTLKNLTYSNDIEASIKAVTALGVKVNGERFSRPRTLKLRTNFINFGGSGTALRMFIPIAVAIGGKITVDGDETLRRRPLSAVVKFLRDNEINVSSDHLPLTIEGKLRRTEVEIDGSESSQYITGLIYALHILGGGKITIRPPIVSKSYINLTVQLLRERGLNLEFDGNTLAIEREEIAPYEGDVPGDFALSSFYAAASIATKGYLEIKGLYTPPNFFGDHSVVEIYRQMGAYSKLEGDSWIVSGESIKDKLKPISINVEDAPDLAVSVASLAPFASGETSITGVKRLSDKESNRLKTMTEALGCFGVCSYAKNETFVIAGNNNILRGRVSCPNDHRIAMMVTPLGFFAGGEIENADCVKKSNPNFWNDLVKIGGRIKL